MTPNQQLENKDRYRAFIPYCEYRNVDKLIAEINKQDVTYGDKFEVFQSKSNYKRNNTPLSDRVIAEIRDLRFKENLPIAEIAKKLDLSRTAVYKYVNAIAYK